MLRDIYQHNLQSFLSYSSASRIAIDKWGLKIFPSADTARNPPRNFTLHNVSDSVIDYNLKFDRVHLHLWSWSLIAEEIDKPSRVLIHWDT